MSAYVKGLKDKNGNIIYPQTVISAVYDSEGKPLSTILETIKTSGGGNSSTDSEGNTIIKVQADWNETNASADGYIKNKPNLTNLATENYVDTKISDLVDSAPETLNTLNELAEALNNDNNFASTITAQIANKQDKGNYATQDSIPTKLSDLDNDSNFITLNDVPLPTVSNSDNGKILVVVDGSWAATAISDLTQEEL